MKEHPDQSIEEPITDIGTEAAFGVLRLMTEATVGSGKSMTMHAFGTLWFISVERLEQ